jgi:smad nuclear-interacting protein 1
MGSDTSDGDYRSRRRKYEDDGEVSSSREKRHRDGEGAGRPKRSKDRSRHRHRHSHRCRSVSGSRDASRENDGSTRQHQSSHSPRRHHHRHRSTSPTSTPKQIDYPSSRGSPAAKSAVRRSAPLPSQDADFAVSSGLEPVPEKEQPNFKPTGALAAAANAVTASNGETVTLKYHEPPEARKPAPRDKWKMFVFKGKDVVDTIELSLRSCWLVGRDRAVVDLPAEHPSVSKQHAVIQFRYVEKRNEFGDRVGKVKPYLIDLESANGTVLNGDRVPESRYLEVRDRDVIKFGLSEREYVVMLDRE